MKNYFENAQSIYDTLVKKLENYGVSSREMPELRSTVGLLPYYDRDTREIYVPHFDRRIPSGRAQITLLRVLLGCQTDNELLEALDAMTP